tara:strand:- start:2080 stop:2301 length:222 start_codon:yes stop_codon:yes gene_type:complete
VRFIINKVYLIKVVTIESIMFVRKIEITSVRLSERRMKVSKDEIEGEMSMGLEEGLGTHHEIFISHPTIADPS